MRAGWGGWRSTWCTRTSATTTGWRRCRDTGASGCARSMRRARAGRSVRRPRRTPCPRRSSVHGLRRPWMVLPPLVAPRVPSGGGPRSAPGLARAHRLRSWAWCRPSRPRAGTRSRWRPSRGCTCGSRTRRWCWWATGSSGRRSGRRRTRSASPRRCASPGTRAARRWCTGCRPSTSCGCWAWGTTGPGARRCRGGRWARGWWGWTRARWASGWTRWFRSSRRRRWPGRRSAQERRTLALPDTRARGRGGARAVPARGGAGMSGWLERLFYPERPEGPLRELALSPLAVAEALFAAGVQARTAARARGWLRAERVPGLRVISVGNVQVGGAGKTPVVRALAERFARAGPAGGHPESWPRARGHGGASGWRGRPGRRWRGAGTSR